jgi:hypothetical protein
VLGSRLCLVETGEAAIMPASTWNESATFFLIFETAELGYAEYNVQK